MRSAMMTGLRRIDDLIGAIESILIASLCGCLAILLFTNVLLRYVFRSPFAWIEEIVIAAFVWMIFLGVSACVRSHQHLRIDIVPRYAGPRLKSLLGVVSVGLILAIMLAVAFHGYQYAAFVAGNRTPILGVSAAWLYVGLPLGMVFAAVHVLRQTIDEGPAEVLQSVLERED